MAKAMSPEQRSPSSPWWDSFFDEVYADCYLPVGDEASHQIARNIVKLLGLQAGDRVLDQCCGTGRIALALSQQGMEVEGVEWNPAYVRMAEEQAGKLKLKAKFVVGDAFEFVAKPKCRAVCNIFTSFGLSSNDDQNLNMLKAAFNSLESGGHFVLEHANIAGVLNRFEPQRVERRTTPNGEWIVIRESTIALSEGLMRQTWTFISPKGARSVKSGELRLHMPHELIAMVEAAGFERVSLMGGFDGSAASLDSLRIVLSAQRP